MQPCWEGWDASGCPSHGGTLMAGVSHPLRWAQLAAGPLGTERQGWSPAPDRGRKQSLTSFKNSFLASSPPARHPPLLPPCSAPLAASLPPAGPGNFPVAVETRTEDALQSRTPNKKWLCVCLDSAAPCWRAVALGHPAQLGGYRTGGGSLPAPQNPH